ncbi:MAG TPA: FISUMP domain-containing protein, partial [Candidatus Saccharibacteria bacterium]|nr:FISUMP domain-containing protein [Candidatus Saccharibacteria bacterium]
PSPTHTFEYTFTPPNSYCLSITNPTTTNLPGFHITNTTPEPSEGVCEGHTPPPSGGGDEGDPITDGDFMQDVTTANCPTERTMAVDARDNHTYWVQKLADGKCWMLTNLGYTGDTSNGGSDSYGDTRTIVHETTSTNSYTQARYQTPVYSGTLVTIYPTEPSTDTTGGTAAGRQRGYFYNWCAAMGVQTGTSACLQSVTQPYDANVSICPSGWRLPTGGPAPSELATLNGSVNGGLTNTDAGLRTTWLAQRAGFWNSMHFSSGTRGDYWSSTQYDASSAYTLHVSSSTVGESAPTKQLGFSVRCLAV